MAYALPVITIAIVTIKSKFNARFSRAVILSSLIAFQIILRIYLSLILVSKPNWMTTDGQVKKALGVS